MRASYASWPLCSLSTRCSRTHRQERRVPSLYCEQSNAQLNHYLVYRGFLQYGPATSHSHAASIQRNPATPASVSPTPPVSSPSPDTNGGIDLQAIRSLGCLTLQLCQTNQMWKGEPSELLVAKGYCKAVAAKLLQVVDETFCSGPTEGANCYYLDRLTFGALAAQCKPAKHKRGLAAMCRPPLR